MAKKKKCKCSVCKAVKKSGLQVFRFNYDFDDPDGKCKICNENEVTTDKKFMVKGHELELTQNALCKQCSEEYLNKHSIICSACGEPIIPGTPVGGFYWQRIKESRT